VTGNGVYRHLAALQKISDSSGGNRGYDKVGFSRSAAYVTAALRAAGYDVSQQQVPYTDFDVTSESLVVDGATAVPALMTRFTPSTPATGIDAAVAALPTGRTGCASSDYNGVDVTGAVVVIARAACGYTAQQQVAAAAGARALLIYYPTPTPQNNYRFIAYTPADFTIPMASISQRDGEELIRRSAAGARVHLTLQGANTQRTTTNVLAETRGGDPNNVVMVGGHLDSVTEGPGINDNGSTAAAVLQIALKLAPHQNDVTNKVRFAWWGAEELVDVGSAYYVANLSAAERGRITALLNGELIASPNAGRFVWDPGTGGGHVIADLFAGYFGGHALPYQRTSPDSVGSDHLEFIPAGIPVGGIDGGNLGIKTPAQQVLFGGQAGQMFDPCYHQPCDSLNNINQPQLAANAPALAWVVGRLASHDDDVRAATSASSGKHLS
jgi:N-acetylated-alpha-linked acidic dipeptidase